MYYNSRPKFYFIYSIGAETLSHGKAQIGNVDYSFQGVLGVWLGPSECSQFPVVVVVKISSF